MISLPADTAKLRFWRLGFLCWLILSGVESNSILAQPPERLPEPAGTVFSIDSAIVWALQNNPELAAIRQRHGIAAAAVVIARTYPFNPVLESELRNASGPPAAGVTNHFHQIYKILLELELRGQGTYRRQGAYAALSRTDWEIAYQELLLAGKVTSAFNTLVYRKQKLQLLEEAIRLNEQTLKQLTDLRPTGKTTAADLPLARSEIDDTRAQRGLGRSLYVTALSDFRRQLGTVDLDFDVAGSLDGGVEEFDVEMLTQAALEKRPDLHAKAAALAEAQAQLDLTRANRFGNPTAGPDYEFNETNANIAGIQFSLPIPALNIHKGDIFQRLAERDRAGLEVRQNEVLVRQDVKAAVDRLNSAAALAKTYQTQILPNLQAAQKEIQDLLTGGAAGIDIFRLIDVRRKLIKARDGYLDALFEVSQARADLAVAIGELAVPVGP